MSLSTECHNLTHDGLDVPAAFQALTSKFSIMTNL